MKKIISYDQWLIRMFIMHCNNLRFSTSSLFFCLKNIELHVNLFECKSREFEMIVRDLFLSIEHNLEIVCRYQSIEYIDG